MDFQPYFHHSFHNYAAIYLTNCHHVWQIASHRQQPCYYKVIIVAPNCYHRLYSSYHCCYPPSISHPHPLMMIGPLLLKITWNSQVGGSWPGCSGFPQTKILRFFHRSDLVLPARLVCLSLQKAPSPGCFERHLLVRKNGNEGGTLPVAAAGRGNEGIARVSRGFLAPDRNMSRANWCLMIDVENLRREESVSL